MDKHYFNSTSENVRYYFACTSCRAEFMIEVYPYPHGPATIQACPVCGASAVDSLNIHAKETITNG